MIVEKVIINKIMCKKCSDIVESKHRHDFRMCKCECVGVDRGHDYLRRTGNREDYEELSITEEVEIDWNPIRRNKQ